MGWELNGYGCGAFFCTFLHFSRFFFFPHSWRKMSITFSILKILFSAPRKPIREGRKEFAETPESLGLAKGSEPGDTEAGDVRPALCGICLSACRSAP